MLYNVACKIPAFRNHEKESTPENSQVQNTVFFSLFFDDARDAYLSLMLVHHRPWKATANSRSSKPWCRVRELIGIQQKWHAMACLFHFLHMNRFFLNVSFVVQNMVYTEFQFLPRKFLGIGVNCFFLEFLFLSSVYLIGATLHHVDARFAPLDTYWVSIFHLKLNLKFQRLYCW